MCSRLCFATCVDDVPRLRIGTQFFVIMKKANARIKSNKLLCITFFGNGQFCNSIHIYKMYCITFNYSNKYVQNQC